MLDFRKRKIEDKTIAGSTEKAVSLPLFRTPLWRTWRHHCHFIVIIFYHTPSHHVVR